MKVIIGNYKTYLSPYKVARALCFWVPKKPDKYGELNPPDWVDDFGEFLAYGFQRPDPDRARRIFDDNREPSWFYKFLLWFNDVRGEQRRSIRIDPWDIWSMDSTLTPIILPMLQQLREKKHGSPGDMPAFTHVSDQGLQLSFDFYSEGDEAAWAQGHVQWTEIMDKMIWSFEQLSTDWEQQFHHGKSDLMLVKQPGTDYSVMERGPLDTSWFDIKGYQEHDKKIQEGLELFGKYFRNLWD